MRSLITFAGYPPTTFQAGKSLNTVDLARTTHALFIVIPGATKTSDVIQTLSPIVMGDVISGNSGVKFIEGSK